MVERRRTIKQIFALSERMRSSSIGQDRIDSCEAYSADVVADSSFFVSRWGGSIVYIGYHAKCNASRNAVVDSLGVDGVYIEVSAKVIRNILELLHPEQSPSQQLFIHIEAGLDTQITEFRVARTDFGTDLPDLFVGQYHHVQVNFLQASQSLGEQVFIHMADAGVEVQGDFPQL